jgi:hypothetical protein
MKRKYEKPAFAKAPVTLQAVTASPTGVVPD